MKTHVLLPVVLLLLAGPVIAPALSADPPDWKLRVELVDGSRIVGTTTNKTLTVDLGFAELKVPFERIRRAQRAEKTGTIRMEMTNRDVLTGKLRAEPLHMQTIFGQVKLSMQHVVALEVFPGHNVGWLPTQVGLVLYYPLDDGAQATNNAADKHHGKATGVKWLEHARRGGGFAFNGSGRLTVKHHPDLCPQKLTLAAWICPRGETSSYQIVMAKTNAGSWTQGYGLVRNSGDAKHLRFFVNSYSSSAVQAPIPADRWSHVAGVYDGQTLSFYLNGKLVDTKRLATPINHCTAPLTFGGGYSGSYAWQGTMDEIALYKRALSAAEVQRLYESGADDKTRG